MIQALTELGYPTTRANPFVDMLLEDAPRMQRLYNLATAPVGYFNTDTEPFVEWLKLYISALDRASVRDHAAAQVRAAIYEPESDIGRRIRLIEAGEDSLFPGKGPWVYWEYLVGPTILYLTPRAQSVGSGTFEQLVFDYGAALYSDPIAYANFAEYLVSVNYDMGGLLPLLPIE